MLRPTYQPHVKPRPHAGYGELDGDGVGAGEPPGAGLPLGTGLPDGDGAGVGDGVGSGGQPWVPFASTTTRGVAAPPRASMVAVS